MLATLLLMLQAVPQTMPQPAQLPHPYATAWFRQGPPVVAQPEGAALHVPDGFTINVFAEGLRHARKMALAPNGDVFLAEGNGGQITVLRDADRDGVLTRAELEAAHERAAATLPNLAIPEINGVGAMEVVVSVPHGVCDFISAMDTPRIAEWNMWYHLLDCGFPVKLSGETDFPCMSGTRVGQGRVYVRLGDVDRVDFDAWCAGLAAVSPSAATPGALRCSTSCRCSRAKP